MTTPADPVFSAVQRALAGQYSLERELGRGGMGVVYLAREVELDRLVALKALPPAFATDPETRERFVREARMAASLSHPHIVPIYRVGEVGDVVFFSMAFIDGMTLGERLRARGPLPPSAASRMLREVAQALAYAHGRGIIHRDVKPDNILLDRESGRALVSDFGIAGGEHDDGLGAVMGTPQFMSPEQSAGAALDARSDIYSLGVVGYLSLSGSLPFHGATHAEIEAARRAGTPASLGIISPSTPPHLVTVIDRALRSDPSARFQSAESLANAIDAKSIARVELPAPLRVWLDTKDPWMTPYVGWSLMWAMAALGMATVLNVSVGDFVMALLCIPLPLLPAVLFQARKAVALFDAGFSVDDIRAALVAAQVERDDEASAQTRPASRWIHGTARAIAWSPIILFFAGIFAPPFFVMKLRNAVMPGLMLAACLSLPILNAAGVSIFPKFISGDGTGGIARRFWNSKLGEWTERLLMRGRSRTVAAHAFRPTEMVLGAAVEDLFKSLPAVYRDQLGGVPAVIQRLKQHATTARAALTQLDSVTIPESDPLLEARETARRNLTDSVTAIESIRLDLLRLLGGDVDLRPTTTVLEAARRVGDDLDRLSLGQREVRHSTTLGLDLRPHTPI